MLYRVTNEPLPMDWNARGDALLLQNLANLLRSWTGEIPFLHDAGVYAGLQDMPSATGEALLVTETHRLFAYYAPRVKIQRVQVEQRERLRITVDVEVKEA